MMLASVVRSVGPGQGSPERPVFRFRPTLTAHLTTGRVRRRCRCPWPRTDHDTHLGPSGGSRRRPHRRSVRRCPMGHLRAADRDRADRAHLARSRRQVWGRPIARRVGPANPRGHTRASWPWQRRCRPDRVPPVTRRKRDGWDRLRTSRSDRPSGWPGSPSALPPGLSHPGMLSASLSVRVSVLASASMRRSRSAQGLVSARVMRSAAWTAQVSAPLSARSVRLYHLRLNSQPAGRCRGSTHASSSAWRLSCSCDGRFSNAGMLRRTWPVPSVTTRARQRVRRRSRRRTGSEASVHLSWPPRKRSRGGTWPNRPMVVGRCRGNLPTPCRPQRHRRSPGRRPMTRARQRRQRRPTRRRRRPTRPRQCPTPTRSPSR